MSSPNKRNASRGHNYSGRLGSFHALKVEIYYKKKLKKKLKQQHEAGA